MAGKSNSKLKTLVLADILREQTDEDHPMSATELCQELSNYNIDAERKSIYTNLSVLEDYGMDIIKTTYPKKGFFLGEREFQLAEVRLMVDAVQSAGFISDQKTRALIAKMEKVLSRYQKEEISRQVYVEKVAAKTSNENIYYTIDELYRAIRIGRKVRLHYQRRKIAPGESVRYEERIFTLSPYGLIWFSDHYYLVCNNQKYDNFMHIRVERIRSVDILDEPARDCAEISSYKNGFDASDYLSKIFNGYTGETERVTLRCNNELIQSVTDRFGEDIPIISTDEETFTISVNAAVGEGFIDWLLQFGDTMVVTSPEELQIRVYDKAAAAANAYAKLLTEK